MGNGFHPGASPFDVSHHVGLGGNVGAHYGTYYDQLKNGGRDSVRNPRPWHRNVAECDYHVCRVNRYGEVWDYFGGELYLVGKSKSDRNAIELWKLFLQEHWGMDVISSDIHETE